MNKRGQFFILGAMIMALALFVLMVRVNTYEEKILLEDFPDLSKNYESESVKVVNDALLNNLDENKALSDFTKDYVNYARTLDPNLGFVYVYYNRTSGEAVVSNYLGDQAVNVYTIGSKTDALFGDSSKSINDVSLNIGGIEFKKTIPVNVNNFDPSMTTETFPGKISLEIAGVFYDVPSSGSGPLTVIARSATSDSKQVEVSVL